MNGLEPLVTVHAGTGAFRAITSDLLAETYLAPRPQLIDLNTVLADGAFPWSASMTVAPLETTAAVSAALRNLAVATQGLNPDEIGLGSLDGRRPVTEVLTAGAARGKNACPEVGYRQL